MFLADKKKLNNIAEYIIYVWQNEDLIRAYDFDVDRIDAAVISFLPEQDEEKLEIKAWYSNLATLLLQQGLKEKGHVQFTHDIISELNTIHNFLLNVGNDTVYKSIYDKSSVKITEFKQMAGEVTFNDVDICMNGLYGLLLLRLNGKTINDELLNIIDGFGEIMGYLAFKYREKNAGMWN